MAFRLVTLNLNGIRSAAKKGFLEWAESASADCMGVQELKAQSEDLDEPLTRVGGAACAIDPTLSKANKSLLMLFIPFSLLYAGESASG